MYELIEAIRRTVNNLKYRQLLNKIEKEGVKSIGRTTFKTRFLSPYQTQKLSKLGLVVWINSEVTTVYY